MKFIVTNRELRKMSVCLLNEDTAFYELEGEPVEERFNCFAAGLSHCRHLQGDCDRDNPVEEKCEHESINCHTGKCWDCGAVPLIEELHRTIHSPDDDEVAEAVEAIGRKLNEVIRRLNSLL